LQFEYCTICGLLSSAWNFFLLRDAMRQRGLRCLTVSVRLVRVFC